MIALPLVAATLLAAPAPSASPAATPSSRAAIVSVLWPGAVSAEQGDRVESLVRVSLVGAKVPMASPAAGVKAREKARGCATKLECIAALGTSLDAAIVVRVEPAAISRDIAVLVQAIDASTGKLIAEENLSIAQSSLDAELPKQLATFASKVKSHLDRPVAPKVAEPPKVADAPKTTPEPKVTPSPTPPPEPPAAVVVDEAPAKPFVSKGLALGVLGVGAAVAVGGGVLFATAGSVTKDANGYVQADQADKVPGIQRQQALGVGLAAGGAAVALVGAGLFALAPADAPAKVAVGPGGIAIAGRF